MRARRESTSAGASPGHRPARRLTGYFVRHLQVLVFSLGRLWRAPGSSVMTVSVIGIALALPAGMDVLVNNARNLSGAWEGAARISVFLHRDITDAQAGELAAKVRTRPEVADVRVIGADEALAEFRQLSGFGEALAVLKSNPLPAVLVIRPKDAYVDPIAMTGLLGYLKTQPQTDRVQLDTQWLRRLHAILNIIRRGVLVISALLGLAVIIIVGNTIRLDIQNRRDEIEVTKLIGGSDAFIRRPFLYSGFWYGVMGGVMAWLLVTVALWLMAGPVSRLSDLYGSDFSLAGLDLGGFLSLLVAGSLLGWLGSWLAVTRHLGEIEPA